MSFSRYEPLGPVTTVTRIPRIFFFETYACNLASTCFPSALNMISNPGMLSSEICSSAESVSELRLHRSRVAAWFSMSGTVCCPMSANVFHSLEPASFW